MHEGDEEGAPFAGNAYGLVLHVSVTATCPTAQCVLGVILPTACDFGRAAGIHMSCVCEDMCGNPVWFPTR
jgi:hypothetical protein